MLLPESVRIQQTRTMVNSQYLDRLVAEAINDAVTAEDELADALVANLGNHPPGFGEIH